MSDTAINLRDTIVPKSDQLNADELLAGPLTITVTNVTRSSAPDQPICVHYQGDNGKPYKPCKSMRKVLIFAWGDDGRDWIGKRATLYNDPEVKFGGVKVGGIRISHMSGIQADLSASITETKGKKKPFFVKKLPDAQPQQQPTNQNAEQHYRDLLQSAAGRGTEALRSAWATVPQELWAQLKPHLNALKPVAAKFDLVQPAAFNPPVNETPAVEPQQQPEQKTEQPTQEEEF